ncbi:hypothetical protein CPB85DRAFT_548261 [Mucidula mucida]|nr:hypothetical protein CPB85DRAFT_548261 [Mucidula mucida]
MPTIPVDPTNGDRDDRIEIVLSALCHNAWDCATQRTATVAGIHKRPTRPGMCYGTVSRHRIVPNIATGETPWTSTGNCRTRVQRDILLHLNSSTTEDTRDIARTHLSRVGARMCPASLKEVSFSSTFGLVSRVGTGGLSRVVLFQHVFPTLSTENGPLHHLTRGQALVDTCRASVGCWLAYGALYGIWVCVRPLVHFAVHALYFRM